MMLFSRDRNPNVILDPPPPPPPPPQMPPLPVAYGVMDLGAGPTAILAEKPGAAHRGYRTGEKIGAFKILAMNNHEILFDWDGQPVKKTLEELAEKKSTIPCKCCARCARAARRPANYGDRRAQRARGLTWEMRHAPACPAIRPRREPFRTVCAR